MSAAGVPLLETKLRAPRRHRGVLARARLDRRLASADLPSVVLVSAPAGFGKTTLLAEWLAGADRADLLTAWVSLDRRDSDPAVFWTYVVAALRKVIPEAGTTALATLQSSPSALESVVGSLLNDLAAAPADVVLVLDDYHVVESLEVHESMRFLVEHLPAQLHLVVASRADPPWPLAGLRARGELLEVRAAELRFTGDEAAAYLNDAMSLDLTAADIDTLESRTEGWIAALQLAALSLKDRDDPAAFIAGFAGDDRFVVDYLVDEVLDRQPEDIRTFLLETSILSRLTGPLCVAVTGRIDARSVLEKVERYHHLFGDVLRARLADEHPDGAAELHRRASTWFEAAGDRAEAIRHAMAARISRRPLSSSSSPSRSSDRPATTPPSVSGSMPSPPRCSPTVPSSRSGSSAPTWSPGTSMASMPSSTRSRAGSTRIAPRATWWCTTTSSSAAYRPRPRCTELARPCCAATSPARPCTANGPPGSAPPMTTPAAVQPLP